MLYTVMSCELDAALSQYQFPKVDQFPEVYQIAKVYQFAKSTKSSAKDIGMSCEPDTVQVEPVQLPSGHYQQD